MNLPARILKNRRIVRAPIGLYRIGWGWMLGRRFLMLEHRGRTSQLRRFVVLEVVVHESPDDLVVASGFGPKAQWYQNILAEPRCRVSTGLRRRMPAMALPVSEEDSRRILGAYERKHPATWAALLRLMRDATGNAAPEIPLVRLRLSTSSTSPR